MSNQRCTVTPSGSALQWTTRIKGVTGVILLAAALGFPTAAIAAPVNCGPRAKLLEELAKRFSEAPVAVGLANGGALVEVLTNGSGSTWTIIVSQPNGTSCLVAAGESWQELNRVASGELEI